MRRPTPFLLATLLFTLALPASTAGGGPAAWAEEAPLTAAPVSHWSREAQRAIVPPGPNGLFGAENYGNKFPGEAAVYMGIVHAAIYDAAVAIEGGYQPYAIDVTAPPDASPEAAIATAAHHVLVGLQPALGLTPAQEDALDQRYDDYLAAIPESTESKDDGIAVGEQVAEAVVALRQNDGRESNPVLGQPPFVPPPPGPGVWDPGTSQAVGLRVPGIRPLGLESASQFRPDGPDPLTKNRYAKDFEEVKELGRFDSATRTEEQTAAALFWTDHDLRQWNDGLLGLAAAHGLDLVQTARMLAMAHVSGGDAMIACFDAKYTYWYWRPYQAIPRAHTDGNDATEPDTTWSPLRPTPNFPEYPSAHACHTTALSESLHRFFGTDQVSLSLDSRITGKTRVYDHLHDVVTDVNQARVLAGFHFFNSDAEGAKLGRKVSHYVVERFFLPNETGGTSASSSRIGLASGSGDSPVTIRFSHYVDVPYAADPPESEVSCSLRLPRGSNGIEVLRAAVNQDCIRSFRTEREHDRELLHCISHVCARVTNSQGLVPDTRWDVDWTGDGGEYWQSDYWRSGLKGYSASDGDSFTAYLYAVN